MNEHATPDAVLTFIPQFSGTLSILGASAILFNILSDPQRRFTKPYFRIMFGLSVANLLYAISRMFSTFAVPKGTPGLYYSFGNQVTCNAQGFFMHLGLSQALYTACLCVHYLLVIKYSKSDEYVAKYFEPYMHILSIGFPLLGSIIGVALGNFNSSPIGCWIGSFPMNCDIQDKSTCTRGQHSRLFLWVSSGSLLSSSFIIIAFSMLMTVLHVRNRMRVMNHRFNFRQSTIARSRNLDKQYRLVKKQAIIYVGTFVAVWIFEYIFRIDRQIHWKSNSHILIPEQILNPMQGFFNFIIYIWPRYTKSKEENSGMSVLWLIKDAMITSTRIKTERRRSHDMNRRIVNKRMSILRRSRLRGEITQIEPPSRAEKEQLAYVEEVDKPERNIEELDPVLEIDENSVDDILGYEDDDILSVYTRNDATTSLVLISNQELLAYGLTSNDSEDTETAGGHV